MILEKHYLVTRNAREKVQIVIMELHQNGTIFTIKRITGQHFGKMTDQPEITIEKGKVKRSVLEQAQLEFNSKLKGYLDKGYKKLSDLTDDKYEELDAIDMDKVVPSLKSDQDGNLKCMLAKDYHKCQVSVLNKEMWGSRKLNGVRNMMKWDSSIEDVKSISRGGQDYDIPSTHLRNELYDYLKNNPDIILDGELYVHGVSLQQISGIARLKTWENRCEKLEYHIYDICDASKPFVDRMEILEELKEVFKDSNKIFILDHYKTNSWDEVKRLHDKFVKEGYEGIVCRKPDKVYGFGKRGSDMIKVKEYLEDSFKIIDYVDGLRGTEDFCFIMETIEGKTFKAKPTGSRKIKEEYIENIDSIIGLKGDVKFFEWSDDNIPMQTIFLHVRYDL